MIAQEMPDNHPKFKAGSDIRYVAEADVEAHSKPIDQGFVCVKLELKKGFSFDTIYKLDHMALVWLPVVDGYDGFCIKGSVPHITHVINKMCEYWASKKDNLFVGCYSNGFPNRCCMFNAPLSKITFKQKEPDDFKMLHQLLESDINVVNVSIRTKSRQWTMIQLTINIMFLAGVHYKLVSAFLKDYKANFDLVTSMYFEHGLCDNLKTASDELLYAYSEIRDVKVLYSKGDKRYVSYPIIEIGDNIIDLMDYILSI